jgi:hypothetical protein
MASPLNSQTLNQTNPDKYSQHPNQDQKKAPNDNLKAQALDMRMRSNSLLLRHGLHLLDLHVCTAQCTCIVHSNQSFPLLHCKRLGTNELIGATGDILRGPFWNLFQNFNGIFYSIISSISSKLVQKIFNVVNNGMFFSKNNQFQ